MAIYRTCCHRVSVVLSTVVLVLAASPLLLAQSPMGTGRVKFGDRVHRPHRTKPRPGRHCHRRTHFHV